MPRTGPSRQGGSLGASWGWATRVRLAASACPQLIDPSALCRGAPSPSVFPRVVWRDAPSRVCGLSAPGKRGESSAARRSQPGWTALTLAAHPPGWLCGQFWGGGRSWAVLGLPRLPSCRVALLPGQDVAASPSGAFSPSLVSWAAEGQAAGGHVAAASRAGCPARRVRGAAQRPGVRSPRAWVPALLSCLGPFLWHGVFAVPRTRGAMLEAFGLISVLSH